MISQHVGLLLCALTNHNTRPSYQRTLSSPSTPHAMMLQCQVPRHRHRHSVSGTLPLSGLQHVQWTAHGKFVYEYNYYVKRDRNVAAKVSSTPPYSCHHGWHFSRSSSFPPDNCRESASERRRLSFPSN